MAAQHKLTANQVARFKAIRAKKAAAASKASTPANDNARAKSAYVDTTMTPGMLAACVAAAGFEG